MPSNNIEWVVVLGALEKLSTELIHNLPRFLGNFIMGNGTQEIPCISQPISTKRTKLRKLKAGTPNFQNVAARGSIRKVYAETQTALNNNQLAGLHVQLTELSLDIKCTLLRNNQELAVRVDECLLGHVGISDINVSSETFSQGGISRAGNGLQTRNEVDFASFRDVKGVPGQLGRRDMNAGIERKKVGLGVFVVW